MAPATELDLQQLNDSFAIPGIAQIVAGNYGQPKIKDHQRRRLGRNLSPRRAHHIVDPRWIARSPLSEQPQPNIRMVKPFAAAFRFAFPGLTPRPTILKHPRMASSAPNHGSSNRSLMREMPSLSSLSDTRATKPPANGGRMSTRAVHRVTISSHLQLELIVTNTGEPRPFSFQEALHTYYHVGNVREVSIASLDGVSYLDNTPGQHRKSSTWREHLLPSAPTTLTSTPPATLNSPTHRSIRRILIGKAELAQHRRLESLGTSSPQAWPISATNGPTSSASRAANIRANAVTLQPGEQHTMTVNIRVQDL